VGPFALRDHLFPVLGALSVLCLFQVGPLTHAFDEDELECTETLAELRDCCPKEDLEGFSCHYSEVECNTVYPDLTATEAVCLRDLSCSELRALGVCERMRGRVGVRSDDSGLEDICNGAEPPPSDPEW
jgi:hypothetical protein